LLIIGGPTVALPPEELKTIEQYLDEGGRLLALFNYESIGRPTGLENILSKWGIEIGNQVVVDPAHTTSGSEVYVGAFSKHPVVNPLLNSGLCLFYPRPVSSVSARVQPAGAPHVEVIAETGPRAFLNSKPPGQPQKFPLMVAVEKGAIKGVITERGTTRMVVVGDSLFLANHQLDVLSNRDFASYAANWLLDRTQLLEGLGPRPINEFRLVMTRSQLQQAQWLLLGGMPGAVLLLGSLVWFRRRR
ncbi:MAG TPA: hypothetical protein VNT26_12955, partial [Candidatus Sulfotelmatobacter sp.]|nr:hypothetical protein [Candidatus Sulfotelmatobacter sp.]